MSQAFLLNGIFTKTGVRRQYSETETANFLMILQKFTSD